MFVKLLVKFFGRQIALRHNLLHGEEHVVLAINRGAQNRHRHTEAGEDITRFTNRQAGLVGSDRQLTKTALGGKHVVTHAQGGLGNPL